MNDKTQKESKVAQSKAELEALRFSAEQEEVLKLTREIKP